MKANRIHLAAYLVLFAPLAAADEPKNVIVIKDGDDVVALTAEQRLLIFRAYNQQGLDAQKSGDELKEDRPCEEVVDVGHLAQNTFWMIKCSDGRSYQVQVSADGIMGPLSCNFLQTFFGQSCDTVTWTVGKAP